MALHNNEPRSTFMFDLHRHLPKVDTVVFYSAMLLSVVVTDHVAACCGVTIKDRITLAGSMATTFFGARGVMEFYEEANDFRHEYMGW